jgi:hypothetical protein
VFQQGGRREEEGRRREEGGKRGEGRRKGREATAAQATNKKYKAADT